MKLPLNADQIQLLLHETNKYYNELVYYNELNINNISPELYVIIPSFPYYGKYNQMVLIHKTESNRLESLRLKLGDEGA